MLKLILLCLLLCAFLPDTSSSAMSAPGKEKGLKKPELEDSADLERLSNPCAGRKNGFYATGPCSRHFLNCTDGRLLERSCAPDNVFVESKRWCDYHRNVPECDLAKGKSAYQEKSGETEQRSSVPENTESPTTQETDESLDQEKADPLDPEKSKTLVSRKEEDQSKEEPGYHQIFKGATALEDTDPSSPDSDEEKELERTTPTQNTESLPGQESEGTNNSTNSELVSNECAGRKNGFYATGPCSRQFLNCTDGRQLVRSCAPNNVFVESKKWCDYQYNVPECDLDSATEEPTYRLKPINTQQSRNLADTEKSRVTDENSEQTEKIHEQPDESTELPMIEGPGYPQKTKGATASDEFDPASPNSDEVKEPQERASLETTQLPLNFSSSIPPTETLPISSSDNCVFREDGSRYTHEVCSPNYYECRSGRSISSKCRPGHLFDSSLELCAPSGQIAGCFESTHRSGQGICSGHADGSTFSLEPCSEIYSECSDEKSVFKACSTGKAYNQRIGRCVSRGQNPECALKTTPEPLLAAGLPKCRGNVDGSRYTLEFCSKTFFQCLDGKSIIKNCNGSQVYQENRGRCVPKSEEPSCSDQSATTTMVSPSNDICDDQIDESRYSLHSCSRGYFECRDGKSVPRNCPQTQVYQHLTGRCGSTREEPTCEQEQKTKAGEQLTKENHPSNLCEGRPDGKYRHPSTCSKFVQCYYGRRFDHVCPPGLLFNPAETACDRPDNVPGCTLEPLEGIGKYSCSEWSKSEFSQSEAEYPIPMTIRGRGSCCEPTCEPRDQRKKSEPECSGVKNGSQFRNSTDCTKYFRCVLGRRVDLDCPKPTVFNIRLSVCDQPKNVPECEAKFL